MFNYFLGKRIFLRSLSLAWLLVLMASSSAYAAWVNEPRGLSNNVISSVVADSSGNKWFGTAYGVSKYDGATWTNYNKYNSGLCANYISKVFVDSSGDKWFLSERYSEAAGLSILSTGGSWTTYNTSNGLADNRITDLIQASNGDIWISYDGGKGIGKFSGGTWTNYASEVGYWVTKMAAGSDGKVYFGAGKVLYVNNAGVWSNYPLGSGGSIIRSIFVDNPTSVWVGTDNTVYIFNGSTITSSLAMGSPVTRIIKDSNNNIWAGSQGSGTAKRSGGVWTKYLSQLTGGTVSDIAADNSNGKVGVGTLNGFNLWDGAAFTKYPTTSGLIQDDISDIEFNGGIFWIGTSGGASKFDYANWSYVLSTYNITDIAVVDDVVYYATWGGLKRFNTTTGELVHWNTKNSGIQSNKLNSVAISSTGTVWIGTEDVGIIKYTGGIFSKYSSPTLTHDKISKIRLDASDNVWAASFNSLMKANPDGTGWQKKLDGSFNSVFVDSAGNVWVSTWNTGVKKYDPALASTVTYNSINGAPTMINTIFAIGQDSSNNMWFAGPEGAVKLSGSTYTTYGVSSGISNNGASVNGRAIMDDGSGNIWIGTDYGLSKLSGSNFTNYNTGNSGLLDNSVKAIAKDATDKMWFGTGYGVSRNFEDFNPPTTDANPHGGTFTLLSQNMIPEKGKFRVLSGNVEGTPSNGNSLKVELLANEPETKIYYTTDGTLPTNESKLYTGPLYLTKTTILKFYGEDLAGNAETSVHTEEYNITSTNITEPKPKPNTEPIPDKEVFSDITNHWAKESIISMSGQGIITGYLNGSFQPDNRVTRAEFIVALMRVLNMQDIKATMKFKDNLPAWAADDIKKAGALGLITGYTGGNFKPNDPITRVEMAVIINRAIELKNKYSTKESDEIKFSDVPSWAKDSIKHLTELKIVKGTSNKSFKPNLQATRAEMAVILDKLIKVIMS